jgi:hypothetical protein
MSKETVDGMQYIILALLVLTVTLLLWIILSPKQLNEARECEAYGESYGMNTAIDYFKEKCNNEGLDFVYWTGGNTIRCEDEQATKGRFFTINFSLESSYNMNGSIITWKDSSGRTIEIYDYSTNTEVKQ